MTLTFTMPDEMAAALGNTTAERMQRAHEAISLELYRAGRISLRAMGRMAGVGDDYWAADQFRVRHGVPLAAGDTADPADEEAVRELLGA
ncbi:MAG: UPF0175 family protein [Verrucomicrobia bacterium]|nr:UPF0175 family protein [Verrucomicrobiota bacterium]